MSPFLYTLSLALVFLVIVTGSSGLSQYPVCIPTKECPNNAVVFRTPNVNVPPTHAIYEFGLDENGQRLRICRANVTGPNGTWTMYFGKGIEAGRWVNNNWVYYTCWVSASNGSEVAVNENNNNRVQFMYYNRQVQLTWIRKSIFLIPPNTTTLVPNPVGSTLSSSGRPSNRKYFVAKGTYRNDADYDIDMPGVVRDDDLSIAKFTYADQTLEFTDYSLLFCMNDNSY